MKKIFLITLTVLLVLACKKNSEEPTPQTDTNQKKVELASTSFSPGEVVVANANFTLSINENTTITVNGVEVKAGVNSINQIVFLMPVVPAGPITIDYSKVGVSQQVNVTVNSYTPVTNPDEVLDTYIATINSIITNLNPAVSDTITRMDQDYINILNYLKQTLQTNYASLSNEEKIQLAYILQNNTPDPASFGLGDRVQNHYTKTSALSLEPSERLIKVKDLFVGNVIKGIALTTTGVALAIVPSPTLLDKVVAVGLLTSGFCYLSDAGNNIKEIGRIIGVFGDDVTDYSQKLAASGPLALFKDASKKVVFSGEYRTLLKSDSTSTVPVLAAIFSAKKKYDKTYNDITTLLNKIKSWFSGSAPAVPVKPDPIRTNPLTRKFGLPAQNIILNNVSNPNIQILYTKSDTTVTITAKSTTVTTETEFTFDMVYTDTKYPKTLRKTITAVFKPNRSGITVAGGNGKGYSANQLNEPYNVWVDAAGNIYIKDGGSRVIKWAPGSTTGSVVINVPNRLDFITDMAVDPNGNIYISDNYAVQKWAPGAVKPDTIFDGRPASLFFANNHLYVATSFYQVYKVTDRYTKTMVLEDTKDVATALFVDANENIYICSQSNHYIAKFNAESSTGTTVAGVKNQDSYLNSPRDFWVDANGYIYTTENDQYVRRWDPNTNTSVNIAGNLTQMDPDSYINPWGLFLDSQGNIYVADQSGKSRVVKWPPYVQ